MRFGCAAGDGRKEREGGERKGGEGGGEGERKRKGREQAGEKKGGDGRHQGRIGRMRGREERMGGEEMGGGKRGEEEWKLGDHQLYPCSQRSWGPLPMYSWCA